MKKFNWKEFMRTHPLFSSLNEMEIEEVLQEELSEEKEFPQGALIVDEGEVKDTIFLIGSGSVQVVLPEKGGNETSLSILRKGEIFGEMAVLDKRPRSATVKANEKCILLEVKGQEFLKILGDHPDLEFKILLKLSERLRVLNDHLLTIKVQDVDEKLKLFNSKLDAELKAVEASLKAAQAVFDQTKVRTDEVISSAERSRMRLNATATAVSTVVGLALMIFGWFGIDKFDKITQLANQADNDAQLVQKARIDVQQAAKESQQALQVSEQLNKITGKLVRNVLLPIFEEHLDKQKQYDALALYRDIRSLQPFLVEEMLNRIQTKIVDGTDRDYTELLGQIFIGDEATAAAEKFKSGYLLLANAILVRGVDPKSLRPYGFDETVRRLEQYAQKHKAERVDEVDASLDNLFQQDKQKSEAFNRVKQLIVKR